MQQPAKSPFTPEDRSRLEKERTEGGLAIGWQIGAVIVALAVTLWMGPGFLLTLGIVAAAFGCLLIRDSMRRRGALRRDLSGGEQWVRSGFVEEKRACGAVARLTVDGCDFTVDEELASKLDVGDFVRVSYAPESAYVFEIAREADDEREAPSAPTAPEPRLGSADPPATASTRGAAIEGSPAAVGAPVASARAATASGASFDDALATSAGAELTDAGGDSNTGAPPLDCKRCGSALRAEDVHRDLGIARCSYCSTIHDLLLPAASADPRPTLSESKRSAARCA